MIIYTYTKLNWFLQIITFLKHNHSLHNSEVKVLNLFYLRSPSPRGSLKGDVSNEHQVLALKWVGEKASHAHLILEMVQNFRTKCSYFGSIKLMLIMFSANTLRVLSEHDFRYGENISSGKGQVSVLT